MLDFDPRMTVISVVSEITDPHSKLSRSQIATLLELGGGIVRLLERNKTWRRLVNVQIDIIGCVAQFSGRA